MKHLRSYVANVLAGIVIAAWLVAKALLGTRVTWRTSGPNGVTVTRWPTCGRSAKNTTDLSISGERR